MQKFLGFLRQGKAPFLGVFLDPVDEVEDDAPGYYGIIKKPMDLTTMNDKLSNGLYANAAAFKADFDRIIKNCRKYNAGNKAFVKAHGDRLERELEWEWAYMGEWLAKERRRARQAGTVAAPSTATAAATAPIDTASASASGVGR